MHSYLYAVQLIIYLLIVSIDKILTLVYARPELLIASKPLNDLASLPLIN